MPLFSASHTRLNEKGVCEILLKAVVFWSLSNRLLRPVCSILAPLGLLD